MKSSFVFKLGKIVLASLVLLLQMAWGLPAVAQTGKQNDEQTGAKAAASPKFDQKSRGEAFTFATLNWAQPTPILYNGWNMVFGGTVVKVKSEKENFSDTVRRFKTGEIKIERVFLDLPTPTGAAAGDLFFGEGFENLKRGDKVIVFINAFYEKEFVRTDISGTNSRLGFKIKSWDDPIVAAIEKTARCTKTEETWVEGHKRDFRVKMHACTAERNDLVLDDKDLAAVWRRYDPEGFQHLLELREIK